MHSRPIPPSTIQPQSHRRLFRATRLVTFAAAVLAAAAPVACSDFTAPTPLREFPDGVYVLAAPVYQYNGDLYVAAETLFVTAPLKYWRAGTYRAEFGSGTVYRESGGLTATRHSEGRLSLPLIGAHWPDGVATVYHDSLVVEFPPIIHDRPQRITYLRAAPPPPPGLLAALELTRRDTTLLHGAALDVGTFVVRGLDSTGRWVRNPPVAFIAPDGWTVSSGLTIIAPHTDTRATVLLTSGPATETLRVDVVPDLRTMRWSATWTCHGPIVNDPRLGDSATYQFVLDSAMYAPAQQPWGGFPFMSPSWPVRVPWAQAALFGPGVETVWTNDGTVTSEVAYPLAVVSQWADSIMLVGPSRYPPPYLSRPPIAFRRTTDATRVYVADPGEYPGPHVCELLAYNRAGPARLEQLP